MPSRFPLLPSPTVSPPSPHTPKVSLSPLPPFAIFPSILRGLYMLSHLLPDVSPSSFIILLPLSSSYLSLRTFFCLVWPPPRPHTASTACHHLLPSSDILTFHTHSVTFTFAFFTYSFILPSHFSLFGRSLPSQQLICIPFHLLCIPFLLLVFSFPLPFLLRLFLCFSFSSSDHLSAILYILWPPKIWFACPQLSGQATAGEEEGGGGGREEKEGGGKGGLRRGKEKKWKK